MTWLILGQSRSGLVVPGLRERHECNGMVLPPIGRVVVPRVTREIPSSQGVSARTHVILFFKKVRLANDRSKTSKQVRAVKTTRAGAGRWATVLRLLAGYILGHSRV